MSLKAFHLLFIAVSIVLSAFVAAWGVQQFQADRSVGNVAIAVVGVAGAAALAFYTSVFRRKTSRF